MSASACQQGPIYADGLILELPLSDPGVPSYPERLRQQLFVTTPCASSDGDQPQQAHSEHVHACRAEQGQEECRAEQDGQEGCRAEQEEQHSGACHVPLALLLTSLGWPEEAPSYWEAKQRSDSGGLSSDDEPLQRMPPR